MTTFEKLNLKHQFEIVVLNAPPSFEPEFATLNNVKVLRSLEAAGKHNFILAFVTKQAEVDNVAARAIEATEGDAILWFAYPKQTSKKYRCEFNRDSGWTILKQAGFDTVRAVAIDQDWSALRFRRIEFIKNTTRR